MSRRSDAFREPLDPNWQPAVGEHVFLNRGDAAYGTVKAKLLDDLFIMVTFGKKCRQVLIEDMRPQPKATARGQWQKPS